MTAAPLDTAGLRARALLLDGARAAYAPAPKERPAGIRYHRTHCGSCGRPVAADRVCPVHGAPKDES